jgi:hypothetical protein
VGYFRHIYIMNLEKNPLKILHRHVLDMPILRTPLRWFPDANSNHLRGTVLRVH